MEKEKIYLGVIKERAWVKSHMERAEVSYKCFDELLDFIENEEEGEEIKELFDEQIKLYMQVEETNGSIMGSFVCCDDGVPVIFVPIFEGITIEDAREKLIKAIADSDEGCEDFIGRVIDYCEDAEVI